MPVNMYTCIFISTSRAPDMNVLFGVVITLRVCRQYSMIIGSHGYEFD